MEGYRVEIAADNSEGAPLQSHDIIAGTFPSNEPRAELNGRFALILNPQPSTVGIPYYQTRYSGEGYDCGLSLKASSKYSTPNSSVKVMIMGSRSKQTLITQF